MAVIGGAVVDEHEVAALDMLPEAVVVVDADDTIAAVNDRAGPLLALTTNSLGEPLAKAIDVRDEAGVPCQEDWLPPRGSAERIAERILRVALPDGRLRAVAMSGRFVGDRIVLTFRSAGRREQVDAARSDLVATVSHEIRSPLTSVKGFTSTMLRKWDRFSDEQKRAMLETINHDADRVTRLLRELLAVSRIDANRVQLHREMIDLAGILEGLVERSRHRDDGHERDIELLSDDAIPTIMADPDKVEQVFTNLLENAIKYAPNSPVRITVTAESDHVHVVVADEGPGIPADSTRRIFEKFGRGRDNRRSGTGLGLYITRGLIVAHGGTVWCESAENEGARFHVTLPVRPPTA